MKTVLFLLCCYAVTFVLIDSEIFEPIRKVLTKSKFLEKLLQCWFCTGFWSSLFSFLIYYWSGLDPELRAYPLFSIPSISQTALHALAGAAFTYALAVKLSPPVSFPVVGEEIIEQQQTTPPPVPKSDT